MDQTRTGALIRALRQNKQLTQRQLADAIGVSDKAVSKWERGCGGSTPSGARRRACRTSRTARCCGTARGTGCLRAGRHAQKVSRKQQRRPLSGTPLLRFWMHYAMPVTV